MTTVRRADLYAVLEALAPTALAEDWDNVGVILDPLGGDAIERVLLTIDLTEAVTEEAIAWGADAIVAYHPPIFAGLKRLTPARADQRVILRLVAAGIPVVSPHTALDAAPDGMAAWLAAALGPAEVVAPITPARAWPLRSDVGAGRMGVLAAPTALPALLASVRAHLGLRYLRVAAAAAHAAGKPIERFAVCPGAGGGLFQAVGQVDLLLTGELRHHDILARVAAGTTVVLTDHSQCERGYLPVLAARLEAALPSLRCRCAAADTEPLRVEG